MSVENPVYRFYRFYGLKWQIQQNTADSYFINVTYPANVTVSIAFELAFDGRDNGMQGLLGLMPETRNFQDWMEYLFLCYWMWSN